MNQKKSPWDGCECGHTRAHHTQRRRGCTGPDSYGVDCDCPSFELNQSAQEELDPDHDGDGLENPDGEVASADVGDSLDDYDGGFPQ